MAENPPLNLRSRVNFVPHGFVSQDEALLAGAPVQNIVLPSGDGERAWIHAVTQKIGDWRSLSRSVYIRWAITINAVEVAAQRYESLPAEKALSITSLRIEHGALESARIALWPAPEAANHYKEIVPLFAACGLADLFGVLEDIVFDMYALLLQEEPLHILSGDEFRPLRKLWNARNNSPTALEEWRVAWNQRLIKWRSNRGYDGLHRVLKAFFIDAKLKEPSIYEFTDIDDWCATVELIGELRNLIIHGAATVSPKLAALSGIPTSMTFEFLESAQLDVALHHMQSVECFIDQLLTALNLSLLERAGLPLSSPQA